MYTGSWQTISVHHPPSLPSRPTPFHAPVLHTPRRGSHCTPTRRSALGALTQAGRRLRHEREIYQKANLVLHLKKCCMICEKPFPEAQQSFEKLLPYANYVVSQNPGMSSVDVWKRVLRKARTQYACVCVCVCV